MKQLIKKLFTIAGYELNRISRHPKRSSLEGLLSYLKKNSITINTCIDGGAAYGEFSKTFGRFFPGAHYVMVEPLSEYLSIITNNTRNLSQKTIIRKALASKSGTEILNVHPDLFGSSLYKEQEGSFVDGKEREVQTCTLDEINEEAFSGEGLKPPLFVKLDIQGAEIDALKGGNKLLQNGDDNLILLEVSLFETMIDSENLFSNVISFLDSIGYVLLDIYGFNYRPLDNALAQVDCVFCHKKSILRKVHAYADREWRTRQFERAIKQHQQKRV